MSSADLHDVHAEYGAVFTTDSNREIVDHYGRPDRTHRAVRNGVGVRETPTGVIIAEGGDRLEYINNIVTNQVPSTDGEGCYALLLDSHGRIESDMYIYTADDRLLLVTPPGKADDIVENWEVFIQDVQLTVKSNGFTTFAVHGPKATEKIKSVLTGTNPPQSTLSFGRGSIGDIGVTVVRTDGLAGEVSYDVITRSSDSGSLFKTLITDGLTAVPFGLQTWNTLTLEAGTPLFETELTGRIPNMVGVRNAINFQKGCFLGQEVVARIENRGQPNQRLVGLSLESVPSSGDEVIVGDSSIGEVTRGSTSPMRDEPIALAFVSYDITPETEVMVKTNDGLVPATVVSIPFIDGSERSDRLPHYE